MNWSAEQYSRFADERTRPVCDLLSRLRVIEARCAVDLGCGTGGSTAALAARFPGAAVAGIDSSPDMLQTARERLPMHRFELADVVEWLEANRAGPDVILANAVLQWVPDHASIFPALMARLPPGGALAVQMPDNLAEPAHRLMREVAAAGPWSAKLSNATGQRAVLGSPEEYYSLLRSANCTVDIWRTTYFHALAGGVRDIVGWFEGSGLRPFLAPLDRNERIAYLERYSAALAAAYPALSDGSVVLPFPRLFIVVHRVL
jgi:trans-aconitate 2-methyltransferase